MRRHLKTVNGALNTDDPAAESLNHKKCLPGHLYSECKPAAGDKHSKKNKNKIHSHES